MDKNELESQRDAYFLLKSYSILTKAESREIHQKRYFIRNALLLLNQNGIEIQLQTLQKYVKKYDAIINEYTIKIWHHKQIWVARGKKQTNNWCEQIACKNIDVVLYELNKIIDANKIQRDLLQTDIDKQTMQLNALIKTTLTSNGITNHKRLIHKLEKKIK